MVRSERLLKLVVTCAIHVKFVCQEQSISLHVVSKQNDRFKIAAHHRQCVELRNSLACCMVVPAV